MGTVSHLVLRPSRSIHRITSRKPKAGAAAKDSQRAPGPVEQGPHHGAPESRVVAGFTYVRTQASFAYVAFAQWAPETL